LEGGLTISRFGFLFVAALYLAKKQVRGVAHVNRAALETERSRDGEAKFPSSE